MNLMSSLSTAPYKGTRDYYPDDMRVRNYIFKTWQRVCERYGYEEYATPLLEPIEVYAAKTGQEIVNEQTYTFTDRGDRTVAIRPEMTPSISRMVAARRPLSAPGAARHPHLHPQRRPLPAAAHRRGIRHLGEPEERVCVFLEDTRPQDARLRRKKIASIFLSCVLGLEVLRLLSPMTNSCQPPTKTPPWAP